MPLQVVCVPSITAISLVCSLLLGVRIGARVPPSNTPSLPKLPHPAKNLGPHFKAPKSGEIVTSHHRGAKKV